MIRFEQYSNEKQHPLYFLKLLDYKFRYTPHSAEHFLFQKVVKALKGKNKKVFFEQLTVWMLHLDLELHSFDYFLKTYGTDNLKKEYSMFVKAMFLKESKSVNNYNELLLALRNSRKNYFAFKHSSKQNATYSDWLNPTSKS